MPSLLRIRQRIRSIKHLQQVTRAVKMVGAVKYRRARAELMHFRPYSDELARLLVRLIPRTMGIEHPLFIKRKPRKLRALVITADRGLCGSFNTNVLRQAIAFPEENPGADVSLAVIGKKGIGFLKRRKLEVMNTYQDIYDKLSFSTVGAIADNIIAEYVAERIDAYYVIYTLFVSALQQRCITRQVLPFDLQAIISEAEVLQRKQGQPGSPPTSREPDRPTGYYITEPAMEAFCEQLLARYLATTLFRAIVESIASEFAARMNAMDNATNNAGDIVESLTLQYHRARQAAITTEVCEVVAGAEAMQ